MFVVATASIVLTNGIVVTCSFEMTKRMVPSLIRVGVDPYRRPSYPHLLRLSNLMVAEVVNRHHIKPVYRSHLGTAAGLELSQAG